jgi:hypothetical protein
VTAILNPLVGGVQLYGCDEDSGANPNVFQCSQFANNTTDRSWTAGFSRVSGVLTTMSAVRAIDGGFHVFGANVGIPNASWNTFHTQVPGSLQSQWPGVQLRASAVAAAVQPDGRYVIITANAAARSSWNGNVSISTAVNVPPGFQIRPGPVRTEPASRTFTAVAAVRRSDGRIHVFGADSEDGQASECIQSSPNGPWTSEWQPIGVRLRDIAATVTTDGRVHLVGVNAATNRPDELLYCSEVTPGGPRSGWRPFDES